MAEDIPELDISDGHRVPPVMRFTTRLLRRQMFNALARQDFSGEKYKPLLFGSGVVQLYRPNEGYAISRLARDIDVGIMPANGATLDQINTSTEVKKSMGQHLIDAAKSIGAEIEPPDATPEMVYDKGAKISKVFTPEDIKNAIRGKREEAMAGFPEAPVKIPLDISPVYNRSLVLPPQRLGNRGLCHVDIREQVATKISRLTRLSGNFDNLSIEDKRNFVKDIFDISNLLEAGVIDLEKDKELIRLLSIINIAGEEKRIHSHPSLQYVVPTEENIENAARLMGLKEGLDMPKVENALFRLYDAFREIFPPQEIDLMSSPAPDGDSKIAHSKPSEKLGLFRKIFGKRKTVAGNTHVQAIEPAPVVPPPYAILR